MVEDVQKCKNTRERDGTVEAPRLSVYILIELVLFHRINFAAIINMVPLVSLVTMSERRCDAYSWSSSIKDEDSPNQRPARGRKKASSFVAKSEACHRENEVSMLCLSQRGAALHHLKKRC